MPLDLSEAALHPMNGLPATTRLLQATSELAEEEMNRIISKAFSTSPSLLRDALASLPEVGVRLRPFLLRITYEAGGGRFEEVLSVAGGVELIQLSTLVIDDFLDQSASRNGRPSIVATRGDKRAVIVGMALASAGMEAISGALGRRGLVRQPLSVLSMFEATHREIYEGQELDLSYENDVKVSEQQYLAMISKTTASFIRASLVAGVMLWNGPAALSDKLGEIGWNLGMAYQVRDDVIDIVGDPQCTGKPKAGDIRNRRMRLPVVHALSALNEQRRCELSRILGATGAITDSEIDTVARLLTEAGSIEYSVAKTRRFCHRAVELTKDLAAGFPGLVAHVQSIAVLISSFLPVGS